MRLRHIRSLAASNLDAEEMKMANEACPAIGVMACSPVCAVMARGA